MLVSATEVCLNVSQSIVCKNKLSLYIVLGCPNLPLDTALDLVVRIKLASLTGTVAIRQLDPITNLKYIEKRKYLFWILQILYQVQILLVLLFVLGLLECKFMYFVKLVTSGKLKGFTLLSLHLISLDISSVYFIFCLLEDLQKSLKGLNV